MPGFADVILSFTESAKPGITKLACIWLASSLGELDYVCKTKFIFHAKCDCKTMFCYVKPGFSPQNQVLKALIRKTWYINRKTWFC